MVDIVLVEDQEELAGLMSRLLVKEGYCVFCANTGEEALAFLEKEGAKLLLLDLMLPGMDGFTICQTIRKKWELPILIISAISDKEAKMNTFTLGADDYIEKPVDMDLLIAKITALFKRYYDRSDNGALFTCGALSIDQDRMEVYYQEKKLNLTIKEYDLLLLLVENKGKTLSKEYLFSRVWGDQCESENQTLTVHIRMLRDKLEVDKKNPKHIKTVWGVGYRYEEI